MAVVKLDHVQLAMPPGGEAAARAFYGDILGIPEIPKPPHLAQRGGVWFERGELKVHLGVERDFHAAYKAHPAFLVTDLPSLLDRCRENGHKIEYDEALPGFDRAFVFDGFGNRVELLERLSST